MEEYLDVKDKKTPKGEPNGAVLTSPEPPDDNLPNLVPEFRKKKKKREFLEKLSAKVLDDVKAGARSMESVIAKRTKLVKETYGTNEGSQVHSNSGEIRAYIPTILDRVLRLSIRQDGELFQPGKQMFAVKPNSVQGREKAQRLTDHGNWQIENEFTDWERNHKRGGFVYYLHGSVFSHSYHDFITGKNVHEILPDNAVIVPNMEMSTKPDLSDVPFKVRIMRKQRHEVESLMSEGIWAISKTFFETAGTPERSDDTEDSMSGVQDEAKSYLGITSDEFERYSPYVFYEYIGWCDIPGHKRQKPVTVIVSRETEEVVLLQIREMQDWKDKQRFERQTQEKALYEENVELHKQIVAKKAQVKALVGSPEVMEEDFAEMSQALNQMDDTPPVMPDWMRENTKPKPVRMVPIENMCHAVCFESLGGLLGIGVGALLEPFNQMANAAMSKFLDQATLANSPVLFASSSLGLSGNVEIEPGAIRNVNTAALDGDLAKHLYAYKPGQSNPDLINVVKMSDEYANDVSSSHQVLSGAPGKSGETFRGLHLRATEAAKMVTSTGLAYQRFVGNILKVNARLNSIHLPLQELFHFQKPGSQELEESYIGREDYQGSYDVSFTSDMSFSDKSLRIEEADAMLQMASQIPYLNTPTMEAAQLQEELIKESLKARDRHDLAKMVPSAEATMKNMQGPSSGPPESAGGDEQPPTKG